MIMSHVRIELLLRFETMRGEVEFTEDFRTDLLHPQRN